MNQGWTYQEQVDRAFAGATVLEYYTQKYRHSTEPEWRERIATGQVLLNHRRTISEERLQAGQWLTYHRPPWEEPEVPVEFEVLYEDEDLWAIAKPAGLPVLPGGGFLEHTLLHLLQQRYPADTPVPIHRLGRGTSGLMVLARSPLARSHLTRQMRDRQVHKVYRALVGAGVEEDCFTVTQPIGKVPHPILGYVYAASAHGSPAYSQCQVLQRRPDATLLEVTILTGRPHQIRIHLAAAGFPLIGDPLYKKGGIPDPNLLNLSDPVPVPGDCGYHLHAYHLALTHPRTQQPFRITCPAPPELCPQATFQEYRMS
jgi:23S rRNA pseudouridine1911/1915/1917 synthase